MAERGHDRSAASVRPGEKPASVAERAPGVWRIYAILLTLIAVPLYVLAEFMRLGAKGTAHLALPTLTGEAFELLAPQG